MQVRRGEDQLDSINISNPRSCNATIGLQGTVDCGLWTVDCGLWTVDCGLWTEQFWVPTFLR